MEKLLVSACLLGIPCRYDGESRLCREVLSLSGKFEFVPFCPEIYGGLPTPHPPAEQIGERVINKAGADVSCQYERGAECALVMCRRLGIGKALLKEKSPSCGKGKIYDGTFSGTLTDGDGVTVKLLKSAGIEVFGESETEKLSCI